jgi:hypothetical protein
MQTCDAHAIAELLAACSANDAEHEERIDAWHASNSE